MNLNFKRKTMASYCLNFRVTKRSLNNPLYYVNSSELIEKQNKYKESQTVNILFPFW